MGVPSSAQNRTGMVFQPLEEQSLPPEGMAAEPPVTQQVSRAEPQDPRWSRGSQRSQRYQDELHGVEESLIFSRTGEPTAFRSLFQNNRAIIIFVRHFLCYSCKEYVEDLSKIPRESLTDANIRLVVIGQSSYSHIEAFCSLTGYQHEIYVDPERQIYKNLGMRRGETFMETASKSPHVKSGMLAGGLKSLWRAMTSPAFDFQGDPLQQGGALVVGPGSEVHYTHFDMNRFDHAPINQLLQLAGVKMVDFNSRPKIIDI